MKSKHQKLKWFGTTNTSSILFYLSCLTLAILLLSHLSNRNNTNIERAPDAHHHHHHHHRNRTNAFHRDANATTCDLFKGRWIRDERDTLYTNSSCKTIPVKTNCFLQGRQDTDFLHWRWKPDQCELPRFRPEEFLTSLQGKTMAFIGDSLARNQMESLLCLLSTVETPTQTLKEPDDRFATWEFPKQNFRLMVLWSKFLVTSIERLINGSATGSFHIHLDRVDPAWLERLPSIDYAIFSDAPWFFRQNRLYEGGKLIGCVYCKLPDVPTLEPGLALSKAFRTAFQAINDCKSCGRTFSILRTYSPSHFENGTWNTGGACKKTRPTGTGEEVDKGGIDWKYRTIQVDEIERAKKESRNGFEVLDITGMMSVRKDSHPGLYWGNRWMKGYSDCIHWCLPGPIDVWNELLFELIKREMRVSSEN